MTPEEIQTHDAVAAQIKLRIAIASALGVMRGVANILTELGYGTTATEVLAQADRLRAARDEVKL